IDEARAYIAEHGLPAFRRYLDRQYGIQITEKAAIDEPQGTLHSALKSQIRDHWEQETCGVRYGEASDRLSWFRDIDRARQEPEPLIGAFAQFREARGKRVLDIGVGSGSDFIRWCEYAEHATGVDLTEAAIALTGERLQLEGVPESHYSLRTADAESLP